MFHPSKPRTLLLAACLAAGGAALASRASAEVDQNIRVPFEMVLTNPCTGEDVAITGEEHIVSHVTTPKPGKFIVGLHTTYHGTGVGLTTGTTYNFNEVDNFHEKFTEPGAEFMFQDVASLHLISQGSTDNFFVHSINAMKVDQDGNITQVNNHFDTGCNG